MPEAGSNSYIVTTGPGCTVTTLHDQAVAVVAARALGRQLEHRHVRTLVGADRPSLVELEGLLAPLRGARLAAVVDDLRLDPLLSTRSRRREVV
jgi:hypothetical protein